MSASANPFAYPQGVEVPTFGMDSGDGEPATEWERIGTDDRRAVTDKWALPFRWICSLRATYSTGPAGRGTGLLVGPRQVLTAAHCLYRMSDGARPKAVEVILDGPGACFPSARSRRRPSASPRPS
jgi:V8-like Glu-specific endopeptidase